MRFSQRILIAAFATTAMFVTTGAAMAHGYNGNILPALHSYSGAWPVTVTGSQFGNGTACLTLTETGGKSGSASLVMDGQKYPFGSFRNSQRHPRGEYRRTTLWSERRVDVHRFRQPWPHRPGRLRKYRRRIKLRLRFLGVRHEERLLKLQRGYIHVSKPPLNYCLTEMAKPRGA